MSEAGARGVGEGGIPHGSVTGTSERHSSGADSCWRDPATRPVNAYGAKSRVGRSTVSSYSQWRRTIGDGCYASDVDWLEWRVRSGVPVVVAIIETTFYRDKPEWRYKLPLYRHAALERFKRDGHYTVIRVLAERLHVRSYFAVIRDDLAWFMVCRLDDEQWRDMTESEYRVWIRRLRPPREP